MAKPIQYCIVKKKKEQLITRINNSFMQHLNVQFMKKHTLGFTWHSKVVTAIKLKMKLKQNKTKTNKNSYSELNQLVSKKKKIFRICT